MPFRRGEAHRLPKSARYVSTGAPEVKARTRKSVDAAKTSWLIPALDSAAFQDGRNRPDLIARIDRQAGAERVSGIERALAGKHLGRHQVPQHRDLRIFLAFRQPARFDCERDEYRH